MWKTTTRKEYGCLHEWSDPEKVARTQPQEVERFEAHTQASLRTLERLTFGVTTFEQRCKHCNEARTYEVLGASV